MSSINRRAFLGGLAAALAVASIPAEASEYKFVGVDLGTGRSITTISINGMPCKNLIIEYSDDGTYWEVLSTHEEDGVLHADELVTGRYYRLTIKQDDEEIYATDLQLISDQRVHEPAPGKLKRLLGWRVRDRAEENGGSMSGRIVSASPSFEERRRTINGSINRSDYW